MSTAAQKKLYQGPTATMPYFDVKHFMYKDYVIRAVTGLEPGHHKDVKSGEHGLVQAWLWNMNGMTADKSITLFTLRRAFETATLAELFSQNGPVVGLAHHSKSMPYAALTAPGYNRCGS